MDIQFSKNFRSLFGSLALAAVLLLIIFWGMARGQATAQSTVVFQSAQNFTKALQYFYQDQNRFPSVLEFSDQNVMLNYISVFPLPSFSSSQCAESFVYKKVSDSSYQLYFCLPISAGGYQKGWNTINGSPQAPSG